jgi:hypothetical protein
MRGFTIACILGNNSFPTTTKNLKRKIAPDDDDEHPSNKRQIIEGKNKYSILSSILIVFFSFMLLSF